MPVRKKSTKKPRTTVKRVFNTPSPQDSAGSELTGLLLDTLAAAERAADYYNNNAVDGAAQSFWCQHHLNRAIKDLVVSVYYSKRS